MAPLADATSDAESRRLEAALCLVTGGEALTVLRDVCGLEPDEAIAVAHWAAEALLAAAFGREFGRRSMTSTGGGSFGEF